MKVNEFWTWFQQNASRYYNLEEHNPHELFSALAIKLCEIHPDLSFEFSSVLDNNTRELVITANGIHSAFPYVIRLVEAAPKMEDWEIVAFRQRKSGFEDVTIGTFKLSADNVFFDYELQPDKVDVAFYITDYTGESIFKNAVFLILDRLLGEYDVETKLGAITFSSAIVKPETCHYLVDLPLIVDEYFKRK